MSRRIIVGIDRSETASEAFRWALAHADVQDTIVIVHAWQIAAVAGLEAWHYSSDALVARANDLLSSIAGGADRLRDGPKLERLVTEGHAGRVLVEVAEKADLLVVGSRGLGAFRGMLLGSTSNHVVHHAPCPVAVIRGNDPGSDARKGAVAKAGAGIG